MMQLDRQLTGAEVLIKTLEDLGVEYIFGYSGGAVIPIFDAIATTKTNIRLIAVRHEQGAVHMADGYARTTGRPGVVLVTSGPGAGNTISGLMTAQMDSVPMLVISGQQISSMIGMDAFQEADIINLSIPVVKHSYQIQDASEISETVQAAYQVALEGRPGPVVIDIPKDVSSAPMSYSGSLIKPTADIPVALDYESLQAIVAAINVSKKPLLLIGQGVIIANAVTELRQMIQVHRIPAITTLLGKGAVDETEALSLGMLGMHGTAYANKAVQETDCLINIGSRFDDRIVGDSAKFAEQAVICHIDLDETELNKMVKADHALRSDAKLAIQHLNKMLSKKDRSEWLRAVENLKADFPLKYDTPVGTLSQQMVLDTLNKLTDSEAIITTDVGQHQMWAAQFCRVKHERHWLTSGGAGTMGFGMPAAIGAQLARPDKMVISISGDGGFQMTEYELATAANHKLPIKIMIMDNKYLGMVRQWQELFYDNRESGVSLEGNPDFSMLAQAYGIKAVHITIAEEVTGKLQEALSYNDGPVVIWCEVAKTENVYPMIPAGRSYDHMILEASSKKLEKPLGST